MSLRKLIYHPSGRAGEYANKGYAANLFRGCTHGCRYCFSPSILHMSREEFHASVTTVPDVLERLKADMKRIGKVKEPVFLCFTCDPYCVDADTRITRKAIEIILKSGNTVNILTKGGMKATRDFDLLSSVPGNKIGATLTFSATQSSRKWEPKAEDPYNRLEMLREAKEKWIQTWVSIEPVIIPIQSLEIMSWAMPYTDEFKIGKWNHDKRANEIDWKDFALKAIDLMECNNKQYMLKKELLAQLQIPWKASK